MSFLEKLQKSMQSRAAEKESGQSGLAEAQNETSDQPGSGAATFAAYKKTAGPAAYTEDDGEETAKKKLRGRPRKLITADNVEEMAESPLQYPENETKETAKKNPQKTMANKKNQNSATEAESVWTNEGQLAVNVYQTETDLVLQAAIAGIKVEDMDVLIEDDVITIKGNRPNPLQETGDYFIEECYWGPFSRKVILPVEVDSSRADAAMKDGILTIRIPKIQREKKKKLTIKE